MEAPRPQSVQAETFVGQLALKTSINPVQFVQKYFERRLWLTGSGENRRINPVAALVFLAKHTNEGKPLLFSFVDEMNQMQQWLKGEDKERTVDSAAILYKDIFASLNLIQRRAEAVTLIVALLMKQKTANLPYDGVKEAITERLDAAEITATAAIHKEISTALDNLKDDKKHFYRLWTPEEQQGVMQSGLSALTRYAFGTETTMKGSSAIAKEAKAIENPLDTVFFDL